MTDSGRAAERIEPLVQEVLRCYQCGKCTAGCPVAAEADLPPQQVMRLIQLEDWDRVLRSEMIWLCASCLSCSARCPCEVEIADLMDQLRQEAVRRGLAGGKPMERFNRLFLKSVQLGGRMYELGLMAAFNLLSLKPFKDAELAPRLLRRGRLHLTPERSSERERVRRLFEMAKRLEQERRRGEKA